MGNSVIYLVVDWWFLLVRNPFYKPAFHVWSTLFNIL